VSRRLAPLTFLALGLLAPSPGAAESIEDVPTDHWAREAVEVVVSTGLMELWHGWRGHEGFYGERTVSRRQLARVLERVARLPSVAGRYPLVDLSPGGYEPPDLSRDEVWDARAERAAIRRGFLGLESGRVEGFRFASRDQLAHALAAVLGPAPPGSVEEARGRVREAGVMEAHEGSFHGRKMVSRYQLAHVLERLLRTLGEPSEGRLMPSLPPEPPARRPPPKASEEYRGHLARAVRKYRGAARVPWSSRMWFSRTFDRAMGTVARELAEAEAGLQSGSWLGSKWAPPPLPALEPLGVGPGGRALWRNPVDSAAVLALAPGRYLDRDEVTVESYALFLEANPGVARPHGWEEQRGHPEHAATGMSFAEAEAYAAWAGGRLPDAEDWRLATGGTRFPWGDGLPPGTPDLESWQAEYAALVRVMESNWNGWNVGGPWLENPVTQIAWLVQTRRIPPPTNVEWWGTGETPWIEIAGPARGMFEEHEDSARVAPVGSFPLDEGPLGHRDLAGNVREWAPGERYPLVRGGSPWVNPDQGTAQSVSEMGAEVRRSTIGFRVAYRR
jgi:formylglycine-generating enzyme required for sulfatase activity